MGRQMIDHRGPEFKEILNDDRLPKLLALLDGVNPTPGRGGLKRSDDVIEI